MTSTNFIFFLDAGGYPKFTKFMCTRKGFTNYELCYHVDYPNDGFDDDLLLNRKYSDNEWSYTGYLSKEKEVKVALLLPDFTITDDEDRQHTIVCFSPFFSKIAQIYWVKLHFYIKIRINEYVYFVKGVL